MKKRKVALITGAAKRIGAAIADRLHNDGYNIVIHYGNSVDAAKNLQQKLEYKRADSTRLVSANLTDPQAVYNLAKTALDSWGIISVLINNASCFYPTPIGATSDEHWSTIMDVNVKAPYMLSQHLRNTLSESHGCIINITDIYADRPLQLHSVYSASKAALVSLTKSMAAELAPEIRVNAVSPGAILWPENNLTDTDTILSRIPLKRCGSPKDITDAIDYFLNSNYVTGQILKIDGGRTTIP
jgi:pteridine reductase